MKNLIIIITALMVTSLYAGPTKVGNGDDGSDLEGFISLKKGRIFDARKLALNKLRSLNVKAIEHLSSLTPEVEHTKLFITKRNISTNRLKELGAFHSGKEKYVYARTFSRSYAATRFFPEATKLDMNQLVALHIHEALHRSLPVDFRENEKVVTKITLAIVDPMATYDQIRDVVNQEIDSYTGIIRRHNRPYRVASTLKVTNYTSHSQNNGLAQLKSKYEATNHIYPFSNKWSLIGMGVSLSYMKSQTDDFLGALSLFATADLFKMNGFDLTLFSKWNRDTGNSKKFSNSLHARDSFRIGGSFVGRSGQFIGNNTIEYIAGRSSRRSFGNVDYQFDLGSVTHIKAEILWDKYKVQLGGVGQFFLIGQSTINGASTDRSSILGLGPIVQYNYNSMLLKFAYYHVLVSDSAQKSLSVNDLLAEGWAQNQFSVNMTYQFK